MREESTIAFIVVIAAYLIGAIPFGFLIAKTKGVDLFRVGSGNIGATNVGRVVGRRFGVLVFILDFLKGALPIALAPEILHNLVAGTGPSRRSVDLLRVCVAAATLLGHLFPIYLQFRGGKGVATGAGAMFVLAPGPASIALLLWLATLSASRVVSLASIVAAITLALSRLLGYADPLAPDRFIVTCFCLAAAAIVIVKHQSNIGRLLRGMEPKLEVRPALGSLQRSMHLLALGLWLGSAFGNILSAPTIFATFKDVAKSLPSDRTAYITINEHLDDTKKEQLGNALAGAAVGPIFPLLFVLHAVCGTIALITALGWWDSVGRVNHWRVTIIAFALACVAVGWPVSQQVSALRLARFSMDKAIADAAKVDFAACHLASLGLSLLALLLAAIAMMLAANLPRGEERAVGAGISGEPSSLSCRVP